MKKTRKKIFFGWNGNQRCAVKAVELFRARGYDTLYLISTDEDGVRIPGTIFHDKTRADRGLPAEGIDPSVFPPLEAEMVRALYKEDSLILTMMNRFSTSVDEKRRLYHEMLRYWKGVLDTHKPDCIVFSCYPHPPSMFILYSIGRRMGIPILFVHETFTSYRLLLSHEYEKSPPLLSARLHVNKNLSYSADHLPDDLRAFYEKHRAEEDTSPAYMKDLSRMYAFSERVSSGARIIIRSLTDGSFFARVYVKIGRMFSYSLEKEFQLVTSEPDFTVPFVYVPLHLQPEASTSPLGGVFADQILMLEILAQTLPEGWRLYVKENPYQFQWGKGRGWSPTRYPGYYKKIAALRNTHLLPLSSDTFALIKHSRAVAAVTGTALLEAVLRDKPGLIFGYQWYADLPGLFRIDGPTAAYNIFERLQHGYRPDRQQTFVFLKSLGEASIRGVIDRSFPDEEFGVTHEGSISNIVDFLANEMNKMLI